MSRKNNNHLYFSIIIPTRNRGTLVKKKVEQLSKLDYPSSNYEIIVVDNNSEDETLKILGQLSKKVKNLRFFSEGRRGPSFARNLGIKQAKYNYLVFTDDDIFISKKYLTDYEKAWKKHPRAVVIGGKITAIFKGKKNNRRQKLIKNHPWCYADLDLGPRDRQLKPGELLFSGNMSLKRIHKNDGNVYFNEFLGRAIADNIIIYAEDYELCYRFILQMKEVWYTPSIGVTNFVDTSRFSSKYLAKRYFLCGLENYIMDESLSRQFHSKHHSYWERMKESLWGVILDFNSGFFRSFCKSKYDLLTILNYGLHLIYVPNKKELQK